MAGRRYVCCAMLAQAIFTGIVAKRQRICNCGTKVYQCAGCVSVASTQIEIQFAACLDAVLPFEASTSNGAVSPLLH